MNANSPNDEALRQEFRDLGMPPDSSLHFDHERWMETTKKRDRLTPAVRLKGVPYGFSAAAIVLAAALIGIPAILHAPHATATPRNHPHPARIYPWRPLGLMMLHMVTPTEGWGFADTGTAVSGNTVYRSSGGLGFWKPVGYTTTRLTGMIATTVLNLRDAFYTAVHRHPSVVTVDRTTDGGAHWSKTTFRVPMTFGPSAYFSGGLQQAWLNPSKGAILLGGGPAKTTSEVRLYMSFDGGKTWSLRAVHGRNLPGYGLLALSQGHQVWLLVGSTLWHSPNDGRSWYKATLSASNGVPAHVLGIPQFNASGVNGAVVARVGNKSIVYTTRNGGLTWHATSPVPISSSLYLFRLNQSHLWLWNVSQIPNKKVSEILWSSTNGGVTWQNDGTPKGVPIHTSRSTPGSFESYRFVNPTTGFVTWDVNGWPSYYESVNSGKTWHLVTPKARLSTKQLSDINGTLEGP